MTLKTSRFILIVFLIILFAYFSQGTIKNGLYLNFTVAALFFGLPIYGLLRKRYWAVIFVWVIIALSAPLLLFAIAFSGAVGAKIAFISFLIIAGILAILSFLNYKIGRELKV